MRFTYLSFLIGPALLSACNFISDSVEGEGPVIKEEREISDFNEIALGGGIDVYYSQSEKHKVTVETNENLLEYIETEKSGAKLTIDTRDGTNVSSEDVIRVFISGPQLNSVIINGSGSFIADKPVKTNRFNAEINGSGDIDFKKLVCKSYSMNINGSGDISLNDGKSENGELFINGSGDVHASTLKTENLEVEINGSGTVEVFANKKLDVVILGSGDVYYRGNPKKTTEINGSGNIEKM